MFVERLIWMPTGAPVNGAGTEATLGNLAERFLVIPRPSQTMLDTSQELRDLTGQERRQPENVGVEPSTTVPDRALKVRPRQAIGA
jgi:hypothetical protein